MEAAPDRDTGPLLGASPRGLEIVHPLPLPTWKDVYTILGTGLQSIPQDFLRVGIDRDVLDPLILCVRPCEGDHPPLSIDLIPCQTQDLILPHGSGKGQDDDRHQVLRLRPSLLLPLRREDILELHAVGSGNVVNGNVSEVFFDPPHVDLIRSCGAFVQFGEGKILVSQSVKQYDRRAAGDSPLPPVDLVLTCPT